MQADVGTQALKEGQTVTETFTATVTDDFGATAKQIVPLTITCTYDAPGNPYSFPTRRSSDLEAGNLDNGTVVAGTPSANGTLTSSDVDSGATATWSGNASGTYETVRAHV